jgi:hypothetical protein
METPLSTLGGSRRFDSTSYLLLALSLGLVSIESPTWLCISPCCQAGMYSSLTTILVPPAEHGLRKGDNHRRDGLRWFLSDEKTSIFAIGQMFEVFFIQMQSNLLQFFVYSTLLDFAFASLRFFSSKCNQIC